MMSVFLNKLLPWPFLPTGFACLLLVFGLLRRKRAACWAGLLILILASLPAVAGMLIRTHEDVHPRIEIVELSPADVVVVLGGFLRQANGATVEHPEWSEGVDRFERGLDILAAGKAREIVFSRGHLSWLGESKRPEGELLAEIAVRRGVPAGRIVLTDTVGNTAGEAREVARLASERGWTRVVLVTTAWHLPRAVEQFERAGVSVVPFPCDWKADPERPWTLLDFLPSADALAVSETAVREWYGRWFYRLKHWLDRKRGGGV